LRKYSNAFEASFDRIPLVIAIVSERGR